MLLWTAWGVKGICTVRLVGRMVIWVWGEKGIIGRGGLFGDGGELWVREVREISAVPESIDNGREGYATFDLT
jgi:hypothetical protein